jgi:oligopeptide/dipeptide ABC transporter ATP-binding protein
MSLLSVRDLSVAFQTDRGRLQAVSQVSVEVKAGETVGLVGESGCGKSTLGKAILRLVPISGGRIVVDGKDITDLEPRALKPLRRDIQMIFQDPYGSLNPRHTIGKIIGQPLVVAGASKQEVRDRVDVLMDKVGLPREMRSRFPHEFSGGQRQRIGIARALTLNPKIVICDEPVSALDVSVRAQVINLMRDLQQELGVAYLFISHDLSVVEHISDRLIVMYLGRVVESGYSADIWARPAHPYTQALLAAAPLADPKAARSRKRMVLQGELPSPFDPPTGCAFHTRCPFAQDRCRSERPALRPIDGARQLACHFDLADHAMEASVARSARAQYVTA